RRCGPCCSPFHGMLDIYTAVQIRGQSALIAGALVDDGRTATAGCVLRLARAIARALGNFSVNEVIAWSGALLRRLAAPSPPPWDRGRRLGRFAISTALWRCRRPPRGWRYAAALPARPKYRVAAARSPCGSPPARPGRRRARRARAEGSH